MRYFWRISKTTEKREALIIGKVLDVKFLHDDPILAYLASFSTYSMAMVEYFKTSFAF